MNLKPSKPVKPESSTPHQLDQLKQQLLDLSEQLSQAQEKEKRVLADYQNMMRRQQEEHLKIIKFATKSLMADLIQPLSHLALATQKIQDQGLEMVVKQFWQVLNENGLQEIECSGQPFDPATMEVVDKQGEGEVVVKVVQSGYLLNGEVIQVAKVVVGAAAPANST